jgi:hypothetical protein
MSTLRENIARMIGNEDEKAINTYLLQMDVDSLGAIVAREKLMKHQNEIDPKFYVTRNGVSDPRNSITTPTLQPVVTPNPKPFKPRGDSIAAPMAELEQSKKQVQEINDSTEFGKLSPEERAAMAKSDPDRLKRITQEWIQKMAKYVK